MTEFNLDKEPKIKTGFKTPENYFENFEANVLQRLPENEAKVISIFAKRRTWIFAAAAVLVTSLMIPIVNIATNSNSELDKATIESYLTEHANISDADLAEFLEVEDIQKIQIDSHIEDKAIEDLLSSNSNLEEYMVN
jgi:hypothetical protein